ncbi:MAG: Ldh family oxidoreductase [Litorilinea sp.]
MPTLAPAELVTFVEKIFVGAGAPADIANTVAASLVNSDLMGHESHGVVRVRQYLDGIARGDTDPAGRPQIVHERPTLCLVDAGKGFGQVGARFAMEQAIGRARDYGLSAVGLKQCAHVGRLGEWVELGARENLVALAFCNGGGRGGAVTPFWGAERVLGTNPIAAALPNGDGAPIVLDFATSAVAEGKVRVARNRNKPIPEGWVINSAGEPTTNPNDLYEGGMLLPAAGHKGYGLSLLAEYLGGVLTGAGCPCFPAFVAGNGVLFMVIDVEAFRPFTDYQEDSTELVRRVKAAQPAPGFDEVLLPGEPEQRMLAQRTASGLTLDAATWTHLTEAATEFGIAAEIPSAA